MTKKFLGLITLIGVVVSLRAKDSSVFDYEDSKFWPLRLEVRMDVIGETHGNLVKAGGEWEFLRYQNGKSLVDMGHNGIHAFEAKDTDLEERMHRNQQTREFPFQGLFAFRYTKSFYLPENPSKGLELGELDEYDYFVLFYFDYAKGGAGPERIGAFLCDQAERLEQMHSVKVLLLAQDNVQKEEIVDDYIGDGFVLPTVIPFLYPSVEHSLHHQIAVNGDTVLVDKYGKILGQFFLSDIKESSSSDLARIFVRILQEHQ